MELDETFLILHKNESSDRHPPSIHRINVSGGFKLYVEEFGNKNSPSALYLHGGWGPRKDEGKNEACDVFDPERFRVIFFHQRGWGNSEPIGQIEENFLENSVEDCETVRKLLKIEYWNIVYGGSNGATLALAYAACCGSEIVNSLILRGLWLMRQEDLLHDYGSIDGKARHYPAEFQRFLSYVGLERHILENDFREKAGLEVVKRYLAALLPNKYRDREGGAIVINDQHTSSAFNPCEEKSELAKAWLSWDGLGGSVVPCNKPNQHSQQSFAEKKPTNGEDTSNTALLTPEYETACMGLNLYLNHNRNSNYGFTVVQGDEINPPFHNQSIAADNILELAQERLKNMPIFFITGEFDMLCPPKMAYEVAVAIYGKDHSTWKRKYFRQVHGAAHSARDPGMKDEIRKVVKELTL